MLIYKVLIYRVVLLSLKDNNVIHIFKYCAISFDRKTQTLNSFQI
jgi:hypothetical protein